MKSYSGTRPGKEHIRDLILGRLQERRPIRKIHCYLTLPGTDLCCVRHGIENNRFTENTTYLFAEYDPKIANHIKITARDYIKDGTIIMHEGDLFDMDLSLAPKIDLAYIDLECTVTIKQLLWVHNQLLPRMNIDGEVVFTQAVNRGGLIKRIVDTVPAIAGRIQMQVSEHLGESITTLQAVTYGLLQASLVKTHGSWFKSYSDTCPMEVYAFRKLKSTAADRKEALEYLESIRDDFC